MNQSIQKRVKWLFREYGITRQEIIEQLKDEFERRNMHRRHNPDKSCLETYVLTFCYYGMLSLVKKYKKNLGRNIVDFTDSEQARRKNRWPFGGFLRTI